MFPEASTWQADVVRVTDDGRAHLDRPSRGTGYRWPELVPERGLAHPEVRHHADAGLANQLAFLASALDWVADEHAPRRRDAVPRGRRDDVAQHRPAAASSCCAARTEQRRRDGGDHRPADRQLAPADRRVARSSRQHAGVRAAADAGRPDRVASTCGRSSAMRSTGGSTATRSTSRTRPGIRSCRATSYVGVLWTGAARRGGDDARVPDTRPRRSSTFAVVDVQRVPLDDPLPQQPRLPDHRARRARRRAVRARAVGRRDGCGRRSGRPPLDPTAPGWPLWLLRLEAATVYGASGLSKLVDGDWFGGTVTWQRVVRVQDRLVTSPLPDWAVTVLTNRSFHTFAAKVIVATELFIAFGLWWRATRYAAVWVAVCFHIAIQLSASVEVFSYLGIAALVIWAVPSTRDRLLVIDPATRVAPQARPRRPVTRLAGPLPRRAGPPGSACESPIATARLIDGGPAVAVVSSRLPLTAWFALPTLVLPSVRRARTPQLPRDGDRPAVLVARRRGPGRRVALRDVGVGGRARGRLRRAWRHRSGAPR